jgi:hypothetical protein
MRVIWLAIVLSAATAMGPTAMGQTTRPDAPAPDSAPSAQPPSADQLLNQMLRPTENDKSAAIAPQAAPSQKSGTLNSAIAPGGASVGLLREGCDLVDRLGRLQKSADGVNQEFVFESDGQALGDPPMGILPNLKLMQMEEASTTVNRDLRFRVTGTVTEYRGRNYILLEKVVVVPDKNQDF